MDGVALSSLGFSTGVWFRRSWHCQSSPVAKVDWRRPWPRQQGSIADTSALAELYPTLPVPSAPGVFVIKCRIWPAILCLRCSDVAMYRCSDVANILSISDNLAFHSAAWHTPCHPYLEQMDHQDKPSKNNISWDTVWTVFTIHMDNVQ